MCRLMEIYSKVLRIAFMLKHMKKLPFYFDVYNVIIFTS